MALIKCKECGDQVSDKAASCPKCGAPVAKKKQRSIRLYDGVFNFCRGSYSSFVYWQS